MIVIKVELWPRGYEAKAREIGRMHITNTGQSQDPKRGHYQVQLMRRGTKRTVQREGSVEDHPRLSSSIWVLVVRALKAVNF